MTNDVQREYSFLRQTAGVLDLSARSRLCVTGADRQRFLNGQVTNNIKGLPVGQGCYAALVNAKGKLQSDLNIYCLPDEFLLDFEPGLAATVKERLEKYVIADDVQVIDVSGLYALLTVQGPKSAEVVTGLGMNVPEEPMSSTSKSDFAGEIYCMSNDRGPGTGFDIFVPSAAFAEFQQRTTNCAEEIGGGTAGFDALEIIRVEAGIPRFGIDMDETNLAPEAGIETRAISYTKGCYIGQEVISRIRAYGQVAKSLRGLRLRAELPVLPARGEKLFRDGKEVGYVTSAVKSPIVGTNIALGYVRREHNAPGTTLELRCGEKTRPAVVCSLPFTADSAT
jgi:folate-binding protein YgfZ